MHTTTTTPALPGGR